MAFNLDFCGERNLSLTAAVYQSAQCPSKGEDLMLLFRPSDFWQFIQPSADCLTLRTPPSREKECKKTHGEISINVCVEGHPIISDSVWLSSLRARPIVSCIEVNILAADPPNSMNTVTADSWPVLPFLKFAQA
nr:unnamed protein product [Callosobruchus chinensis]